MPNNIASERRKLNINQCDLAEKVGSSKSTVSRWERGLLEPGGFYLIKMRNLFGCSTDYLLGVTEERTNRSA